jgi:hypothetical protein
MSGLIQKLCAKADTIRGHVDDPRLIGLTRPDAESV